MVEYCAVDAMDVEKVEFHPLWRMLCASGVVCFRFFNLIVIEGGIFLGTYSQHWSSLLSSL